MVGRYHVVQTTPTMAHRLDVVLIIIWKSLHFWLKKNRRECIVKICAYQWRSFSNIFPVDPPENGSIIDHRDKPWHLPFHNIVISLYAVGTPCGRLETTRLIDNRKKIISIIDMKTSNMRHGVHLSEHRTMRCTSCFVSVYFSARFS